MTDQAKIWVDRLQGKRICIVGNAPSMIPTRIPVDDHDVIFRFNNYIQGGEWGSRTTYYCTTMRKEVRTDPNVVRAKNIPLVFTGHNPSGAFEHSWEFAGVELENSLGCWPSSGLMAFYIACASKAAHITLAAMALGPSIIREPAWSSRYAPPWAYHNFLGERRVLARLLQVSKCPIDLPPALGSLALPSAHYPDPIWTTLASELNIISEMGEVSCSEIPDRKDDLHPDVMDRLQRIANVLSKIESSMEGVKKMEPFFYLPREKVRHNKRWLLFHPTGARLMNDLLVKLRRLQTQYPSSDG